MAMHRKDRVQTFLDFVDIYWYRNRVVWLMVIMMVFFFLITARLFHLQIVRGEHYQKLSENNCIRLQRVKPLRGLICDRSGRVLVENRPSFDIRIVPKDAKPLAVTLENLASCLALPLADLESRIAHASGGYGYQPITLVEDIRRDELAIVSANRFNLPGLVIDCNPRRHYLHGVFAPHLIGYLGEVSPEELRRGKHQNKKGGDFIGRSGIEKIYDQHLSGIPGGRVVQVNAIGQLVKILDTVPPTSGHDIHLTIDYDLQKKAHELLGEQCGAVVAMDPATGEILAMASSPGFD